VSWLSNDAVDRLREVATRPELPADRYTLLRPIGRGGMGTVYAARDEQLGREVAIKVSNAARPAGPLDERLQQEARVLAALEHPGIVPVHDAGLLADGRLFYVMKLVRGETLTAHASSLSSEAARLAVFERVAEAVAFAHTAGVVHRDLKPSNIMVGRFGEVLVLDWGVARLLTEPDAGGIRLGTSGFMAPEQARGEASSAGPAADVYALGALLVWLLGADLPAPDPDEATRRLAALTPPVPRRLRAIAAKCLQPSAESRYRDAAALVDDLARYRQGCAVSAHRETPIERAAAWFQRYQTFILLVLAYLVMRTLFAFL
jgi:serine/threonine protein kinase